jgi:hypothetical protein
LINSDDILDELIPKIPWDQKLVDCCLGSLCEEFFFFSIFPFRQVNYIFHKLSVNTKHVQFRLYMSRGEFLLKTSIKLIFMYFLRSSYMQPCGWNCLRVEGQGYQKIVCFAPKILVFHFFSLFFFAYRFVWCHLQGFNVIATIWMWSFWFFSRTFTRSIVLKFWVKTPINKNNSSSLILTNPELKFEECMPNLIWKWGAKDPKKGKTI